MSLKALVSADLIPGFTDAIVSLLLMVLAVALAVIAARNFFRRREPELAFEPAAIA